MYTIFHNSKNSVAIFHSLSIAILPVGENRGRKGLNYPRKTVVRKTVTRILHIFYVLNINYIFHYSQQTIPNLSWVFHYIKMSTELRFILFDKMKKIFTGKTCTQIFIRKLERFCFLSPGELVPKIHAGNDKELLFSFPREFEPKIFTCIF